MVMQTLTVYASCSYSYFQFASPPAEFLAVREKDTSDLALILISLCELPGAWGKVGTQNRTMKSCP